MTFSDITQRLLPEAAFAAYRSNSKVTEGHHSRNSSADGADATIQRAGQMSEWSLSTLLESLHQDVQNKLAAIRQTVQHPGAKGDASEQVWIELLKTYLPKRYSAEQAFVVDSAGGISQQIDVVIFDRQYTPFIFEIQDAKYVPAESVYAVFEASKRSMPSMSTMRSKKRGLCERCIKQAYPFLMPVVSTIPNPRSTSSQEFWLLRAIGRRSSERRSSTHFLRQMLNINLIWDAWQLTESSP